jgi:hypothetical protein
MSISVILDTFKGTIDMAIQEFAKLAGAKVCEMIDEKKGEILETAMKVVLSKFEEDTTFTEGLMQQITDTVEKKIADSKLSAETTTPAAMGGSLSKRKSKRRQTKKRAYRKSRKQYI